MANDEVGRLRAQLTEARRILGLWRRYDDVVAHHAVLPLMFATEDFLRDSAPAEPKIGPIVPTEETP